MSKAEPKQVKALAQYPEDFNEFEWIKYLKENLSRQQALYDKRREIHGAKKIADFWEPVPPPTREMVMDILKNEYMRFPELKSLLTGKEGEERDATAHVWFMDYLSGKYDEGTDIRFKTRQKQFSNTKHFAYRAFCRMNTRKFNIRGENDPKLISFIDEEIEKKAKQYIAAIEKLKAGGSES